LVQQYYVHSCRCSCAAAHFADGDQLVGLPHEHPFKSRASELRHARADLAANPDVGWLALRAACEGDQLAYKKKDPLGFNWFVNAGNGFTGVPYIFQRILPDLAPEIWVRPEEGFANRRVRIVGQRAGS
jgi:hypothetical protein